MRRVLGMLIGRRHLQGGLARLEQKARAAELPEDQVAAVELHLGAAADVELMLLIRVVDYETIPIPDRQPPLSL